MNFLMRKVDGIIGRFLEFEFEILEPIKDEGPNMHLIQASKDSISIAPEELERQHEHAFRPKVLLIGPLYLNMGTIPGGDHGQPFPYEKRSVVQRLLRSQSRKVAKDKYGKWKKDVISKLVRQVHESYMQEIAPIGEEALANILFIDSCVLAGSLLHARQPIGGDDEFWSDIIVLGNQMPFFIFHEFCKIIQLKEVQFPTPALLAKHILSFLSGKTMDAPQLPAHLLELAYMSIDDPKPSKVTLADTLDHDKELGEVVGAGQTRRQLKRCATKLQAAGVKIIHIEHNSQYFNFGISLEDGKLKIPQLRITTQTEKRWLNFIAWEHTSEMMNKGGVVSGSWNIRKGICKCTWAAFFFNDLMCSPSDVQLLKDKGVIIVGERVLGGRKISNRELWRYFRSIKKGLDPAIVDGTRYDKIIDDLNKFRSPSITTCFTQLPVRIYHYCSGPSDNIIRDVHEFFMKGYNFVVALVTFFTIVQTVYAVLSYHFPKKSSPS